MTEEEYERDIAISKLHAPSAQEMKALDERNKMIRKAKIVFEPNPDLIVEMTNDTKSRLTLAPQTLP